MSSSCGITHPPPKGPSSHSQSELWSRNCNVGAVCILTGKDGDKEQGPGEPSFPFCIIYVCR